MTRGYDIYEDEDGNIIKWKRCEVENCENGVCYSLNPDNKFCWPHSMTGGCKGLTTKKGGSRKAPAKLPERAGAAHQGEALKDSPDGPTNSI